MPERWQDELRKLRREEMPDGVRERAESGPRRELPNDGRQRLVAGVVAFAVFIAAGAFAWRAFDGRDDARSAVEPASAVVVDLAAEPFAATLTYEGVTQDGVENGSSWDTPDGTNASSGPYAIEFDSFVRIPAGTPITIYGDATEVSASLANEGNPPGPARVVALDVGADALRAAPGRYRLSFTGTWERGFATFVFGVELVDPGQDGVLITLTGQDRGPVATIASGNWMQEGSRGSYTWCGADDECDGMEIFGVPALTRYTTVAAGALIGSDGDGDLTRLVIRTAGGDDASDDVVSETDGTGSVTPDEPGRYVVWISASWGDRGSAEFFFGIQVVPPTDQIPDVLHMRCTPDQVTLDSTVVRPRSDGFHVVVDASDEVVGVEVTNSPASTLGMGGPLHSDGESVFPLEPGSWHIGCYARGGGVVAGPSSAAFTLVDPEGVYTPVALVCDGRDGQTVSRRFAATGSPSSGVDGRYEPTTQTVEASVAAVPGILPTDVVREAGYPDGNGFKGGPLYTVLRDGRPLARLHIPVEVDRTWTLSVDACPGSGIGPDAGAASAGPTPDVAKVRCAIGTTEVRTPIVDAQPDGFHVDVEHAEGVRYVVVASGSERERVFSEPVDEGSNSTSLTIPVRPGPSPLRIACRADPAAAGEDLSSDLDSGDLYLQDHAGSFLPYAPTCDSSEEVPLVPPRTFLLPAGESYVRGNLSGILDSDTVERAGYLEGRGDEGPWRVVRHGEIVAQVEFPSLEGITCRGAGITGRP